MMKNTRQRALLFCTVPAFFVQALFAQTSSTMPEPLSEEAYVQQGKFNVNETVKGLKLNDVLEQGLRQNHDQLIRQTQDNLLDLGWRDEYESFWIPELKINLSTTPYQVGTLRSGDGAQLSRTPRATFSVGFEEYTLFNWGKDYLMYLNEKAIYQRQKERLSEQRRELKHQLLIQYFELAMAKKVEDIKRDQLRQASFVYRLNREKVTLKRITRQEYYQARSEYLRSQAEFNIADNELKIQEEKMAFLIKDPVGTRYVIHDELEALPLKITLQESARLASLTNPELLDQKTTLENSKRNYDLALRENLPLPRFSVDLGGYRHEFDSTSSSSGYRNSQNGEKIELVATLNASWTISGRGGLFNRRRNRSAHLNQILSEQQVRRAEHQAHSLIKEHHQNIEYLETQLEILNARTAALQRNFDTIMENYLANKTPFVNFKVALEEMTSAYTELEMVKFEHLENKVLLASLIGIEDFPGENFEQVAKEMRKNARGRR